MIRIRVELVEREEQDLKLKISVQDTGVGLQLDDIDKLFVSFSQVDSSNKKDTEGLAWISYIKKLAELLGGNIAGSKMVKGAPFILLLNLNWY